MRAWKLVAAAIQRIFVTQRTADLRSLGDGPGSSIVDLECPVDGGAGKRRTLQLAAVTCLTGARRRQGVSIDVLV